MVAERGNTLAGWLEERHELKAVVAAALAAGILCRTGWRPKYMQR